MDQADLAGRADRHARLPHDRERQRQVGRALLLEVLAEVRPLDVLHRDEADAVDAAERVDVDDVRVVELGRRPWPRPRTG